LHASDSDVWRARCGGGNGVTIEGRPAPVRAYIEQLLPDVLDGRIEPGRVFDRVTNIDGVPEGYQAMNEREAIKVMIEF
jgi:threonine dehydrogenase-like Zn-dependent dehydrogenase